jgi:quercetin dioxygenase-like cupin family protein
MTIGNCGWKRLSIVLAMAVNSYAPTVLADEPTSKDSAIVLQLMQKELMDVPRKQVDMLTVEYPPGGASRPHRHHAQVFVYVLSGSLRMQVQGSPVVTLGPGQTFYEGREDVHVVSANASQSEPAKFLVFMVKDKTAATPGNANKRNTP